MKKLLVLLCAMATLALVACGSHKSPEYNDFKKAFAKYEKAIDKARDCDDLEDAVEDMEDIAEEILDKYPNNTLSEKEEEELTEIENRIKEKLEKKGKKLCE